MRESSPGEITATNFLSDSFAAQHQHPASDPAAVDPVQTKPPQKRKAVPLPKLTRLVFNPSRKSATAFDSTSSYGSEFHAWMTCCTELTAKYSERSAFSALGTALQKSLCEPALARLWCSIISPCISSKTNTYAQEWDENTALTIRGLSSRCCSALGFLHDCRQVHTVCFYS